MDEWGRYLSSCDGDIAGLRVAWSPDLGFATVDPVVREATERAVQVFEGIGCHIEEASPDLPRPDDIWWKLWTSSNAATVIWTTSSRFASDLIPAAFRLWKRAAR